MIGFKITNVNFRQENMNMPVGTFTYGVTVRPVGTILRFKVGAESFTVTGLQAGQLARVNHTFTTTQNATIFYPSTTVGDEIFEPMLEVGTNASSPQAHYLDNEDLTAEAGLKITNETAELYASKSYVNSSIIVSADNITSEVSNQISGLSTSITQTTNSISVKVNNIEEGLLDTGINITDKRIDLIADTIALKTNAAGEEKIHAIFGVDDNGNPILKANHIDIENLTVGKLKTKNKQQPKAIIDINGDMNTFSMFDEQGATKLFIAPQYIKTVYDYFRGSTTEAAANAIIGLSSSHTTTRETVANSALATLSTSEANSLYSISFPEINYRVGGRNTSSVAGSTVQSVVTIKIELVKAGGSIEYFELGQSRLVFNSNTNYYQDYTIAAGSINVRSDSSGYIKARLVAVHNTVVSSTAVGEGTANTTNGGVIAVKPVINRSEIGLNGMMLAVDKYNYSYMVGNTFEVRRGNFGIRITEGGGFQRMTNGSSWYNWILY